jgi:hypothetical protein
MKWIKLFLIILPFSGCVTTAPMHNVPQSQPTDAAAELTLTTYNSVYAHGRVGWGGHLTTAELALRQICHRKDAAAVLANLYPQCHPVGKAYVLSALWHLDTNRFRIFAEDFMKEAGAVPTMSADMLGEVSREELVRGMQYQITVWAFSPVEPSNAARKQDEARKLRDTEEILRRDPNWSGIKSAFVVKEIWDVNDSAIITLATNTPSKREIRLRISAPWHDGKITIKHPLSRLLAAATDLMDSPALDNVPRSKRITVWAEGGHLFEEGDIRGALKKTMAFEADESEWIEVVITDWNPEGWDDNYLKLFHRLGTDVWLNENGTVWDHKVKPGT